MGSQRRLEAMEEKKWRNGDTAMRYGEKTGGQRDGRKEWWFH